MSDDPLLASAVTLANGVRRGEWASSDLIDVHVARIEAVNPTLNAVVAHRMERARAEAAAADARVAAASDTDSLPPLLGVPCTVKEFLAVEGMPHTAGLVHRRGIIARSDATVVRRLRAAGAVILGVTNAPEGGLWAETTNKVYGRTANPWDPSRTAGGSSGGEGAIVAAGGSPFGIGSDIGGSIRIPAALCGVVGHKPSARLVSTQGHYPPNDSPFLGVGPITRRVEDAALILRVIADGPVGDPAEIRPDQLQVIVPEQGLSAAVPEVRAALLRAADALTRAGAQVRVDSLPGLEKCFKVWLVSMATAGFPSYADVLGGDTPAPIFKELAKAAVGASDHTLPPLLVAAIEQLGKHLPLLDEAGTLALREDLDRRIRECLGPTSVLLLPTFPRTAPRHGMYLARFSDGGWAGLFNVLGNPATTVPVGRSSSGLPMGAQLVAAVGRDHVSLAAASTVESALGGWEIAPGG